MPTPAPGDPRLTLGAEGDIRPQVAITRRGLPLWILLLGLAIAAILLFSVLEARRRAASAPPVRVRYDDVSDAGQSAPTLFIPPAPVPVPAPVPATPRPTAPMLRPAPPVTPPSPRIVYVPQAPPAAAPAVQSLPPARVSNESALIIDTGIAAAPLPAANVGAANTASDGSESSAVAARATIVRHRPTIVAQGTLIPAVLESALDSTRAGPVRALVSRDVRGFDGSRILVPRGSRLFGDYRADLQPGQNRALITWTRLVRPDGVTIAIGSPASDLLGRAGVRGKVNSHFFARFGAAILQSTLDIGVNLASRIGNNNSAVVVALPGATQSLSQPLTQGPQIRPTLTVHQGTAISVFVARDLDFTAVETVK